MAYHFTSDRDASVAVVSCWQTTNLFGGVHCFGAGCHLVWQQDCWAEQLARRHTYVYCCRGHGRLTKPGMQTIPVTILFDSRIMRSKSCLQHAISSKSTMFNRLWCGVNSSRYIPMVGFQALWFGSSWESPLFCSVPHPFHFEQWSLYICSSNSQWELHAGLFNPLSCLSFACQIQAYSWKFQLRAHKLSSAVKDSLTLISLLSALSMCFYVMWSVHKYIARGGDN